MVDQPDASTNLQWRKSSASESAECVEVARLGASMLVRDSHDPHGPVLALTPSQWRGLLVRIRGGSLDIKR
ncbi:DUF397 domain-containing protein [Thermomonospora curvata]|uniref:DUF397 domain-containing protein n=1 Tax=Thermomonospora curvata (strain ATCC 19995 / DSM 43183 / JCM 3096 / KCTC 9072 / NBRC 15933 / NCIMB 10081 / Henssen B9) TaxID=471852 RepID=D1A5B5_THECD|nr:DUF397 domain-containing protein [Thermomonospora curvata]ACZ00101.1 protein of unknown function DUF397 [Thermomonospora curvata DSM 43183]